MECNDWTCWPGWLGVGGAAQLLSLLAVAFAIYEIRRRRKRVRPVIWAFDLYGSAEVDGIKYHAAELTNGGAGTAIITALSFVGARPAPTQEHRFKSVFTSGDRAVIPLSSEAVGEAWLVIIWQEDIDEKLIKIEWLPVADPGAMKDEWVDSLDRTRAVYRFRNVFWRRRPIPVGPTFYQQSSYRWSRNPKVTEKRQRVTWSGMAAVAPTMWSWSYASTKPVTDIPYSAPMPGAASSTP